MMQEATSSVPWKMRLLDMGLLILSLAIILTLFSSLRPLARPDALAFLETAREMLVNHNWITPTLNNAVTFDYPPLFYWLTAISFKLFGYSLFAARLWPAIFGIIGVLTLYQFGCWFAGRRMGLSCALIACSSMLPLTLMTAGAPYIMGVTFFTVSLCSIYAAADANASISSRKWLAALFWISCGLNALLIGIAGIVLPFLIALSYFALMRDKIGLKSLCSPQGIAIFFLITLPWYIVATQHNAAFLHYFFLESVHLNYMSHFHNPLESFLLILFATFAALLPWSLLSNMAYWACRPRSWEARAEKPLGSFILVWTLLTLIYLIGIAPQSLFWVALLTPAFSLAFAKALHRWWWEHDPKLISSTCSVILLGVVISTAFFCLIDHFSSYVTLGFTPDAITKQWLWAIYILFMVGFIASFFTLKRSKGLKATAIVFMILGVVGTITFVSALPRLRQDSMQPIIQYIETHQKNGDVIANYRDYYPEISFLLQKAPIVMVDWGNIPTYASSNQNIGNWIVDSDFFWRTISKNNRSVFFIAPKSALPDLANVIQTQHLTSVAETNNAVLFTYGVSQ